MEALMRTSLLATVALGAISMGVIACISTAVAPLASPPGPPPAADLGTPAHRDAVMSSRFCADCHPAIYAEHRQNTHGRAFFDDEARLATRGFRRDDCVRCHTPRPVFETGIGMTPMQRWTDLEEGNTCMSCHGRAGYDYTRFVGGAECKGAFEPDVGTVTDCASCHRIAGTPDQWSRAEHGKLAGRVCIDCHMPLVERPVAVGQPVRSVRSHVFPASSNESQLRRAYDYEAKIDGNEVVVRVTNKGVGHNFPTANRQRAVESLVVVRDYEGNEVARSRLVCRYPYASELAPHQLILPVSSQIPSGKSTQHRVPLTIANGTVECRLYFKLYRPSDDSDAALARCLEERRMPFKNITPSTAAVQPDVEVGFLAKGTSLDDFVSPNGLANVVRPEDPTKPIVVPSGENPNELKILGAMLESHLPEVRKTARERLAQVYPASADVLVAVLGRWSNESFNEAKATFLEIGPAAVPALIQALASDELYVRYHARELLARLSTDSERPAVVARLREALSLDSPLDRRSAAQALGILRDSGSAPLLRARLVDADWDVVHAAATSLAAMRDQDAVPQMRSALLRGRWPETHRALGVALASLGSSAGIQQLIDDLDNEDELQREYTFTDLYAILGRHFGYVADAPASERKFAVSRLQAWWSEEGGDALVHAPQHVDPAIHASAWKLIEQLGGGTDTAAGGDDVALQDELLALGDDAIPALIEGLTFPSGYVQKRSLCCQLLGRLGTHEAAPYLAAALRDPNPAVTDSACWALEHCGDADTLPQLRRYQDRIPSLLGVERGAGASAPGDQLLARAARVRWILGDAKAREDLVNLLSSRNEMARKISIQALRERYGDDRGYDPDADASSRVEAEKRWREP
jgi:HEAT repeat protein